MQFDFASLWTWHTLSVVLDVLITWYFIYHLTHLIKGTKAVQLANGIILIMVARVLAGWAQLTTVTFILDQIVSWSVIGIIVIFQPEIRRGLERLGRVSLFSDSENSKREQQEKLVKELDKAIQYMSKRRIGALITLEQKTGLEEYVETGIKLDALVTGELLINIFIPNTPLHDGAVIIKNNRVQVASAYLPLSD
ncbi:MAG: diadenylate cyclase CdaA, partial [Lactobacillus delbrueckii]